MIEAPRYKSEVASSIVSLETFIDTILPAYHGPGFVLASNRNIFWGINEIYAYGLTTLPH